MSDWYWFVAVVGLLIAVLAEIDIRMHRRDHDRRRKDRRKEDAS